MLLKGGSLYVANVQPQWESESSSGRVFCQVGWVADRPITSSSPWGIQKRQHVSTSPSLNAHMQLCSGRHNSAAQVLVLGSHATNQGLCSAVLKSSFLQGLCMGFAKLAHLEVQHSRAAACPWAGPADVQVVAVGGWRVLRAGLDPLPAYRAG